VAFCCQHSLALTGPAGDPASPVHRLDPRAKVVGLVTVTLVAVSTPLERWPVWVGCAILLAAVAALARVPPVALWRRGRFVLALVLAVAAFLPLVRTGGARYALGPLTVHEAGLAILAAVAAKALLGTASALLLGATTPFPAVLRALAALRVPRLFVLVAALMFRYLFVVVEEVGRMRAALAARGYRPRTALGAAAVGRLSAALFLKTYGRGERVHRAMLARGYTGDMPAAAPLVLRRADVLFVALVVVALVPLRLLGAP